MKKRKRLKIQVTVKQYNVECNVHVRNHQKY